MFIIKNFSSFIDLYSLAQHQDLSYLYKKFNPSKRMKPTVAILLNAPALTTQIEENIIICADGGRNLLPNGVIPYAIVGDLDSISMSYCQDNVLKCPVEKDYTDGERAVRFAAEQGFERIVIYGASGGRADHIYANLSLLAFAHQLGLKAVIKNHQEQIFYAEQGTFCRALPVGTILSCLPFGEYVTLNHSQGLYYPYKNLTLSRYHSVGISNEVKESPVSFQITDGAAFIFISGNDL